MASRSPVVGHARQHRRLHHGHDLPGLRAEHREAQDAVALRVDERLHEAARLGDRPRPQHGAHRQLRDAHLDAAAPGLAFVQADPRERRVREQAEGDEPVARGAIAPGQIVPDDAKVVEGDVGELRAAGALADRPDIGRARLQPVVDRDVAPRVQLDAGHLQPDPGGVGRASRRDQDVAAVDGLLAREACARGG